MANYIFIELTHSHNSKRILVNALEATSFEENVMNLKGTDNYLLVIESYDEIAQKLREAGLMAPKNAEVVQDVPTIEKPLSPADGVDFICQSNLMRKCKEWCGEEMCDLDNNPF